MSDAPPPGPYDPYGQQAPPPYGPPPPYQPPFGTPPSAAEAPGTSAPPANPYADPYVNPYAQPQTQPQIQPQTQPYGQAYSPYPYPPGLGRPVDARPATVTAAGVITLVLGGLTALAGLLAAVVGHAQADELYRLLVDAGRDTHGITPSELATGFAVLGVVLMLSSLAAMVAAVFVLRRSRGARVLLTILAAVTVLFSLVAITSLLPLVTLVGAIATIVLLYSGGANDWFARRTPQPPLPPQPPYPGAPWPGA